MSTKLEKLLFRVGLSDNVSGGPMNRLLGNFDMLGRRSTKAFSNVTRGAAGLFGAGYALKRLVGPATAANEALGEVASLDVDATALKKLSDAAILHVARYGGAVDQFISGSYDIQSAIAGLVGNELATFTRASAILAKGTKSDVATITNYMGTMYGIFERQANSMGRNAWVEQLAGQTATAVQMFKTTGVEMSSAFGNLGAEATAHGVAMNEQLAIMGQLQATMSGSESATKYKSFLAGVGKAQEVLGLQFTDAQGKMLPMVNMLSLIKEKYGEIDTVAKSDLIQRAFGRKEASALVKLLSTNIEGLASNITALGEVQGMSRATSMADSITSSTQRLTGTLHAVTVALGQKLMPILDPFFDKLSRGGQSVLRFMDKFPRLTKLLGMVTIGVFGLVAVVSSFTLIAGLAGFVSVGWSGGLLILKGVLLATKVGLFSLIPAIWSFSAALLANPVTWMVLGVVALGAAIYGLYTHWDSVKTAFAENDFLRRMIAPFTAIITVIGVLSEVFGKLPALWQFGLAGLSGILLATKAGLFSLIPVVWSFTAALLANPITWVVGAVIALGAALYGLYTHWGAVKNAFLESDFMKTIFSSAVGLVDLLLQSFDKIPEWWAKFSTWFSLLNPFSVIGSAIDGLLEKINLIPGIDITLNGANDRIQPEIDAMAQSRPDAFPGKAMTPKAGLLQQFTNSVNQSKGHHIENLQVTTPNFDFDEFSFQLETI